MNVRAADASDYASDYGTLERDGDMSVLRYRTAVALGGVGPWWNPRDRWRQVHDVYVTEFGPEASVLGPPEG